MEAARSTRKAFMVLVAVLMALFVSLSLSTPEMAEAASGKAVKSVALKVGSKTVTKKTYKMVVGKTVSIKSTVKPAAAKKKITYKSNKTKVAKVTSKGKVTAQAAGTAKITVKVTGKDGKSKSTYVNIKVTAPTSESGGGGASSPGSGGASGGSTGDSIVVTPTPTAAAVTVASASNEVAIGHDLGVAAATSDNSQVTWTTSDSSVARIVPGAFNQARITGYSEGTVIITAQSGNSVGTCAVNVVSVPVRGVSLDQESVSLTVGGTSSLKETITPADATNRNVTWTSSNPNVVTVDADGKLTAIGAGAATIIVSTVDGGKIATAAVAVARDSSADVDKVELTVTNKLDDNHPNTVLVGTSALVKASVTKNGAPVGGAVDVRLEGVSGYDNYYEIKGSPTRTDENGNVDFYVGLKDEYANYGPIVGGEGDLLKNAAYASVDVLVTAGGSNKSDHVVISFAQLLAATLLDDEAIVTVANEHDPNLKSLELVNWTGSATRTAETSEGYIEEYAVEQRTGSSLEENQVYLDAAPLLLLPDGSSMESDGIYQLTEDDIEGMVARDELHNTAKLNYGNYLNHDSVDEACVIPDVFGGLEYLNVEFGYLDLSGYSRLVVRAYAAGTDIPLAEEIITPDRVIHKSDQMIHESNSNYVPPSHVVQISDVFKATGNRSTVDLKIYVESAGQVINRDGIGYSIKSLYGVWSTTAVRPWRQEQLSGAVKWEVDTGEGYNAEVAMSAAEARTFLNPRDFDSTKPFTYTVSVPLYPRTGNAIIRQYNTAGDVTSYYLYPSTSVQESSSNQLRFIRGCYATRAMPAQLTALNSVGGSSYRAVEDSETGRFVISSTRPGYIQVTAKIDACNGAATYEAHSFVQFSNTNSAAEAEAKDFFALTGQTIQLEAKVTSGGYGVSADVVWEGVAGATRVLDSGVRQEIDSEVVETSTNNDSVARLVLTAPSRLDLNRIKATSKSGSGADFDVRLTVAGNDVPNNVAALHWIMPGIYYKGDVDGVDYVTDVTGEVRTARAQYRAGESWKIGTKVIGIGNDVTLANGDQLEVVDIGNVWVDFQRGGDGLGMSLSTTDSSATVQSYSTGSVYLTAGFGGMRNGGPCTVTLKRVSGVSADTTYNEPRRVDCVGQGDPVSTSGTLLIPIDWVPSQVSTIALDYNRYFDIGNSEREARVYARVIDTEGNGASGMLVNANLTNKNGEVIALNSTAIMTDAGGYATFRFDVPSQEDTYVFSASVAGSVSTQPATMYFVDDRSTFTRKSADIVSGQNRITVKFNSALSPTDVAQDWFKDLFKVQDSGILGGSSELRISDVRMGSNADEIIVTTETAFSSASNITLDIASKTTDEATGMIHYLMNARGVMYRAGSGSSLMTVGPVL